MLERKSRRETLRRGAMMATCGLVPAPLVAASGTPADPFARVDPEMVAPLRTAPAENVSAANLEQIRARSARPAPAAGIKLSTIPGMEGQPPVPVVIFDGGRPVAHKRGALIWIHGGGFVSGHASIVPGLCAAAATHHWLVVSPEYRLAPEGTGAVPRRIPTPRCAGCMIMPIGSASIAAVSPSEGVARAAATRLCSR